MKTQRTMPLHTTVANLSLVDHALDGTSYHAWMSLKGSTGYVSAAADRPTNTFGWGRLDAMQIHKVAETPLLALERLERVAGQRSRKQSAPIG